MIKRNIVSKILPWIGKQKIIILKGSRQVGKTTLLNVIKEKILGKDKQAQVAYLSADDIDNAPFFSSPDALETYLKQLYGFPDKYIYLLIDEFQAISQAGLFLKNVFDRHKGNLQIIVSGSSSLAITKNSEFLTGRAINFDIARISFLELFNYAGQTEAKIISLGDFKEIGLFYRTFSGRLNLLFQEYIAFGGYPEAVAAKKAEEKKVILESIVKVYLEKDVINFLKVENITAFNQLLRILAAQAGNLVNARELSNTLNISINTLNKYLEILQGTYLFDLIRPFSTNPRSEISKMPKAFILDLGLRNYLLKNFDYLEPERGALAENFVYLALLEQYGKDQINFYRKLGGSEIDFVIDRGRGKTLCEVKYRSKVGEPLAFKNFSKKYGGFKLNKLVITKDLVKEENGVHYLPVVMLPFIRLEE